MDLVVAAIVYNVYLVFGIGIHLGYDNIGIKWRILKVSCLQIKQKLMMVLNGTVATINRFWCEWVNRVFRVCYGL